MRSSPDGTSPLLSPLGVLCMEPQRLRLTLSLMKEWVDYLNTWTGESLAMLLE